MDDLISRQAAIDALDEIQHALWGIDIPSPTVPEYIEHHESVKKVMKVVLEKRKELKNLPSQKSGADMKGEQKNERKYFKNQC